MTDEPPSTPSPAVRIVEVGPRDGLQNIKKNIDTPLKVELIRRLAKTGLSTIEATSFVSPKWIPQLADCKDVLSQIAPLLRAGPSKFPVLVPNPQAFQTAIQNGAQDVAVFVSATEGFSKKNTNCTVDEALARAREIVQKAKEIKIPVRGYVSCVFSCPYDGPTSPDTVLRVVLELVKMGCYEISLGDTLGVGTPANVNKLLELLFRYVSPDLLACHFHDTYGQALANVLRAYDMGIRTFDSSVAGLGGCPYAEGATGNLASEDVVYMFHGMGVSTGIDLMDLVAVGSWISSKLNRENGSRAGTALSKRHGLLQRAIKGGPSRIRLQWQRVGGTDEYSIFRNGANLKVVLTRPQSGNSLSRQLLYDLTDLFNRVSRDDSVSRVIITASGKFFSTGMDLSASGHAASSDPSENLKQFQALQAFFESIDHLPQTTISVINGPCFGGGVGLAFVCDIRLAISNSRFTLSEVKHGLCPSVISKYVVREWGIPMARDAMLTAREVHVSELLRLGIVQSVAEDIEGLERLLDEKLETLRRCAPHASTLCKRLVRAAWNEPDTVGQAKTIQATWDEMMKPSKEAKHGLDEFRLGRSVKDWDSFDKQINSKL